MNIRKAIDSDLDGIKLLAQGHSFELGFVRLPALKEAIDRNEIFLAEIDKVCIGFVYYHHRRDEQTTLYSIAVSSDHRSNGIGKALVKRLSQEAESIGKLFVLCKCPEDLSANEFYRSIGWRRIRQEPGKKRALNIWKLDLNPDGIRQGVLF